VLRWRRPVGEEALAYGILGALAGYFVQNLFLFDTPTALLYWVVLAGWVASQERRTGSSVRSESDNAQPEKAKGLLIPHIQKVTSSVFSFPRSRQAIPVAVVALLRFSLYFLNYQPYLAVRAFGESSKGRLSITERLSLSEESFHTFPAMANLPRRLAFLELARVWAFLSPEERKQAYEFVGWEATIGLSADPHDAPLLISSLLFIQFTAPDATATTYLEPLLQQLQDIAPNRAETHQIMANQASGQGDMLKPSASLKSTSPAPRVLTGPSLELNASPRNTSSRG
jgi:hypothetical protein